MKKLIFSSSWNNFGPKTWSGTPYGIYTALSKKTEIEFLDLSLKQRKGIIEKIKNVVISLNAHLPRLKHGVKKLNELSQESKNLPCIVFSEYNATNMKNLYCYQDLSVDFLIRSKRIEKVAPILKKFIEKRYIKKRELALEFYKNCGGIFTMSQWLKKDLVEQTGISSEKVHVVGGGCNVDISKIDYSQKQGNKFIFVGIDWKRKNGDLVIKAFEILSQTHPDIHLYIAGPEQCPDSIHGQKNIHFLGKLPLSELYKYYNLCDYFVMPSEFEAYGLVFAEALSFGLPCIGKNCFAMPEFITEGENGYLIEETNENELAEKMLLLLENGTTISKTVQNNRENYIKQYSWDNVAQRILDVLAKDGYQI